MARYMYNVVPFKGVLSHNQGVGSVSDQLQELIDSEVAEGWELYQVVSVDIEVKPGCLGAFFGATSSYVRHDQLVFRYENQ